MSKFTYGLLASGSLGLICLESIFLKHSISIVFTDKQSLDIHFFCQRHNISIFIGNPRNGSATEFLSDHNVDVVLSINYLFIIDAELIAFPGKYAVNFHGSLLPKYRGRTPHIWAIINGEKETGITAHFISEGCDTGDILYQTSVPILPHASGADILMLYSELYPGIVEKVIDIIESGEITIQKQNEKRATYFGKRIPTDGQINWNWQKDQIYNWVRAQAAPYPGAFSYYEGQKITIHQISVSDHGFSYEMPNGLLLKGGSNPVVKTPNGAIKLVQIETDQPIIFQKGKVLYERF